MEGVRFWRWLLAPAPTFRLWRRMKLWELRSYEEVIALERDRLVYQARLRAEYGRGWRRKAPMDARMPLRLARYGVPLPALESPSESASPVPSEEAPGNDLDSVWSEAERVVRPELENISNGAANLENVDMTTDSAEARMAAYRRLAIREGGFPDGGQLERQLHDDAAFQPPGGPVPLPQEAEEPQRELYAGAPPAGGGGRAVPRVEVRIPDPYEADDEPEPDDVDEEEAEVTDPPGPESPPSYLRGEELVDWLYRALPPEERARPASELARQLYPRTRGLAEGTVRKYLGKIVRRHGRDSIPGRDAGA
jgi:hypothetical protein